MFAYAAILTLLASVSAQSSGTQASALDIAAVQAHFTQAQIAGQSTYMIPTFTPQGVLNVTFGGSAISIGQRVDQANAGTAPTLAVIPSANGSRINDQSMYSVAMVDADIVGTNAQTTPLTRHWLVNNVMLNRGSAPYAINYTNSLAVTDYAGPGPAAGSGPHRYVVLLYAQSSSFRPPANLSTAGVGLATWNLQSYVDASGLGPLVAANYFQVENGQATVTPVATSAVVTSTLSSVTQPSASSGSSAASGTGSASRSGSAVASGASAAASSSRAAAMETKSKSFGTGLIVSAVGVVGCLVGAGLGF